MTVAELREAKRSGCPVILKAYPPRTYIDIRYNRVLDVIQRLINGKYKPVAVLEDPCGHSITYADPSHVIKEEKS